MAHISPRAGGCCTNGIIRGYGIWIPAVHVDPEHFSKQLGEVLGPVAGIPRGAAVTQADIKKPVRSELELAPVVVLVGLEDGKDPELAAGYCAVGIQSG